MKKIILLLAIALFAINAGAQETKPIEKEKNEKACCTKKDAKAKKCTPEEMTKCKSEGKKCTAEEKAKCKAEVKKCTAEEKAKCKKDKKKCCSK